MSKCQNVKMSKFNLKCQNVKMSKCQNSKNYIGMSIGHSFYNGDYPFLKKMC
jgi:hypothetical protein